MGQGAAIRRADPSAVVYPPNAPTSVRPEWKPEDRPAASELGLLQEHVLDPWQVDYAVLNCYYGIDWLRHPDWAAVIASAVNDWLIDQWFTDARVVGSLVVPARDPAAMIREIERVGDHPRFRQVLLPVRNDRLYGDRIYHPVYEAMASTIWSSACTGAGRPRALRRPPATPPGSSRSTPPSGATSPRRSRTSSPRESSALSGPPGRGPGRRLHLAAGLGLAVRQGVEGPAPRGAVARSLARLTSSASTCASRSPRPTRGRRSPCRGSSSGSARRTS